MFSTKEKANEYAKCLFEECYVVYKDDLKDLDDWHWLTKPTEEDGGWSFNTDREDRIECEVHEVEVK